MSFNGYLIKFPRTGATFPHALIDNESYKATPRQRTEIKAYRDSNNELRRTTSPNHKSKVTFRTIELSLSQMRTIRNILNAAYSNTQQRKLSVEYWDDELLNYRTMTAYIPDITYTITKITANDIKYAPVTLTFIEY